MFRKKSKVTRILAVILVFMLVLHNIPVMAITNDATQQTEGSTLEPTLEQVPVTAPEPAPDPAPEPTPEPAPEPTPEPTPEPEPEKVTYNVTLYQSGLGKVEINSSEYTKPVSVVEGEDVLVNITPEAGYEIRSVTIGGKAKTLSDKGKFTETIPAISDDTSIRVVFVKKTYFITYEAYQSGTVTGSTGKAISKYGGFNTVLPNADASFTVTPDTGYHIDKLTIDDVEINLKTDLNGTLSGTGYTYTFKKVDSNHKVNVKFAINTHTITFNYNRDLGDIKDVDKNETITSDGGSITVDYGSEPTILISPKTGYHIKSVKVGDKELVKPTEVTQSTVEREFKLPKVTENQNVVVTFEINTYEVKAAVKGGYGEITPSTTEVSHNGDVTFTITPQDSSYQIATLTVNGKPVDDYTENKDGERVTYTYTLSDIQEPADIVVGFEGVQVLEGTWDKYVAITPTSGHLVDSYFDDDDNQVLVYSTDASVEITPKAPYDQVDISRSFVDSVSITSSTAINKIIVQSSAGVPGLIGNKRVKVDLPGDLVIAFDKKSPTVQTPSLDGANKETINGSLWFSDAVSLSFGIDNVKESVGQIDYSSEIANVYYRNMADPDDKGTKLESKTGVYSFKTIDDDFQGQYKIWAEDKAGNVSAEQIVPIHIDKTKPTLTPGQAVTIEKINDSIVAEIISFLTFGTFYNKGLKVTVKVSDEASGIKGISLLTSDEKVVPKLVEGSFINNGLTAQASFIIDEESFNGTLKAMVTDKVNNHETYKGTSKNSNINPDGNGIIMIDRKAPSAEIHVNHKENVTSYVREDQTEFYSQDVQIGVKPYDADAGVNAVSIDINNERYSDYDFSTEKETQNSPTLAPIATETTAGEHKAYDVSVIVKDHAGNQSEEKNKSIVIDKEVPTLAPGKSVKVEEISILDSLMKFLPFGSFFTKGLQVTVKVEDQAAGIKQVALVTNPVNPDDEKVVPKLVSETYSKNRLTGEVTFKLDVESFEGNLAVEVTDNVNNKKSYAITNGNSNIPQKGKGLFMIDGVAPSAKINVTHEEDVDFYEGVHVSTGETTEFYSEDVQLDVEANDPHSGVNNVSIDINDKEYKKYDFSSLSERQKNPAIDPIQTSSLVEEGRLFNVSVELEDNAGNTNKQDVVKRTLYIDEINPTLANGKDSVRFEVVNESSIAKFLNYLTFGTFFNKEIKITANVEDDASGIKDIALIAAQEGTEDKKMITPEKVEKDALTAVAEFRFDADSFNGTFSVEVTDNVNNKSEVPYLVTSANSNIAAETSGVVMIEKNKPTAAITVSPKNGRDPYVGIEKTTGKETEFYSGVVTFNVDVEDTDSGINAVVIKVNGKEILAEADQYKYYYDDLAEKQHHPKIDSFSTKQLSDMGIAVNENGSYDVSVEVIDNAGNSHKLEKTIFIDSSDPVISGFTFTADDEKTGKHGILTDIIELDDYGYYFKKSTQVTVKAVDPEVPNEAATQVKSMILYLQDYENGSFYAVPASGPIALVDESEIATIEPVPTTSEVTFTVPASFKGRIFAKAIDHVDNMGEFKTPKAAIIEDKAKHESEKEHITFDRQKTTYKDNKNLDLYNQNVPVKLTVKDTYSGLSKVEWSVVAPNDTAKNQIGNVTEIDHEKTFKKDNKIDGWLVTKTDKNLVQEMTQTIHVNNDSNGIVVKVKITDRAGNTSEDEITFSIDKTLPTIKVTYDNNTADPQNADYFKENRTATIVITERNFKARDVVHLITNKDGAVPALSGWKTAVNTADPNKTTHTATVSYTAGGDYTFDISYRDNAQNAAAPVAQDKFTIDKTKPVIHVSYNNNAAANGNYYKASRTATISITEHNFETSRIKVTGTATDNGGTAAFPAVSTWTTKGDVHTATIQYAADAKYSFDIEYRDMAGNVADDYKSDTFIVDQTVPELKITGVLDQTANNGDVIPVISYSDTNFNKNQISISLEGSNRGSVKLNGSYSDAANGQVYTFKNFEKTKEVDDLYTLSASLTDLAGNVSTKTITFSVNRFGSVYSFDEDLKSIDGKFVQKEKDVIVTETNVDNLKPESITIKVTKNGTPTDLVKGKDYTISETGGKGKWSQYTYVVKKDLFAGDGRYTVTIYSEDAAGNINENIDETKKAEISFGIDKTKPVIVPIDIESGEQYPVDNKDVTISIKDNLVLEGAAIYLNDKKVQHQENGENFTFTIPNSNEKQEVKIVAVDAAGNELTKGVNELIVSTNFLVRWYNNTPLFAGSLGGIGGLSIALAGLFVYRKQKKQPVEE